MFGILLIDKQQGWTSHDVVAKLRGQLGTRKIGHAGTLDPLATGLLVVAVGPATRFLKYLDLEPKEYVFTVRFGQSTNTDDAEGTVVSESAVPADLDDAIRSTLINFLGDIEQLPPMYSAVKKDGRKLYEYARKGQDVEREPRPVTVFSLELIETAAPFATLRCVCSGGTYVRTLAKDIGSAIGCGAHVAKLSRTAVGRFTIDDAVKIEDACEDHLLPTADALDPMPTMQLKEGQLRLVRNGNFLRVDHAPAEKYVALTDEDGELVCVARVLENEVHPECVVPT